MNGNWEADFMGTTTQEQSLWATCFANEVTALRQRPTRTSSLTGTSTAVRAAIHTPTSTRATSYVDIMGLDLYDVDSNTPNTSTTFSATGQRALRSQRTSRRSRRAGKAHEFSRVGTVQLPSGDDPGYIDGMASTVANGDFAFETYFDAADGNALHSAHTTPLSLGAYQEWFGIPAESPATISGTVTPVGGGDLEGVCAEAFLNGTCVAASASTAVNGTYTISGLAPGNYGVFFLPGCGSADVATQWYNDTTTGTQSAPGSLLAVSTASPTSGVNAVMATGTSIAGTVSAATGGADVAGICVSATPVGGPSSAGAGMVSATNGTYTLEGLLPGNYDVEFAAGSCEGNYVTQWYNATPTGASAASGASAVSTSVASPATGSTQRCHRAPASPAR